MSVKYQAVTVGGPGAPIRTAVASGLAVVFGFSVPDDFQDGSWDPATTPLPVPSGSDGLTGDGHCVAVTGFDFTGDRFAPYFICDNSWDESWGGTWGGEGCAGGRFAIDYRWFDAQSGLATDLWVIQAVK